MECRKKIQNMNKYQLGTEGILWSLKLMNNILDGKECNYLMINNIQENSNLYKGKKLYLI